MCDLSAEMFVFKNNIIKYGSSFVFSNKGEIPTQYDLVNQDILDLWIE
jgi:hypothetical protein